MEQPAGEKLSNGRKQQMEIPAPGGRKGTHWQGFRLFTVSLGQLGNPVARTTGSRAADSVVRSSHRSCLETLLPRSACTISPASRPSRRFLRMRGCQLAGPRSLSCIPGAPGSLCSGGGRGLLAPGSAVTKSTKAARDGGARSATDSCGCKERPRADPQYSRV